MKTKTLLIISVLMVLFIGPSLFATSYASVGIVAEQNMSKDFALSTEYETSEDSITSFSETSADDSLIILDSDCAIDGDGYDGQVAYQESFADVSDWTTWIGTGIYSDSDLGYIDVPDDASYDYVYSNNPSFSNGFGYYLEVRWRVNVTSQCSFGVIAFTENTHTGTQTGLFGATGRDYWQTSKVFIDESLAIESIVLSFIITSGQGARRFYVDYLHILPADHMGWQNDGTNTTSVTSGDGGNIATDGDNMTLTSDGDGSSFVFSVDQTTTGSAIATEYYPFLTFEINSITSGDGWRLWQYNGSNWVAVSTDEGFGWTTTTGTHRYSIKTLDTYVYDFRVNITSTCNLVFDFIKVYSIANYTVTLSATSLDDVLYTSSDVLYCEGTSFTSITLDHDPALSIDTSVNTNWTMTTSSGIPQVDFYIGAWLGYTPETSGTFPAGTLTDYRLKFWNSGNVEAITFLYPYPTWELVGEAELVFSVLIDQTALNWFLIILGMFMVPASTLYLVKGGKNNMSMDKAFYFIVAFLFGWGLIFIGVS